ncbi:MAG TPA: radical SAM protein [Spirochaetia bacterium]|nr:radical SAM protein [Spirochaetia bacterium]
MYHTLYATPDGRMYDHPHLPAAGRAGRNTFPLQDIDLIPLPEGASLVLLPDSTPVGCRQGLEKPFPRTADGKPALAVAACLPQGFTRTFLPAFRRRTEKPLPIMGYTAVAWREGRIYAAALPTDDPARWSPANYNTPELSQLVEERLSTSPDNKVLSGLAKCALEYRCFTAQNIFYRRWEGGLPTTPACNARCLGCLSLQDAGGPPSPQNRVACVPQLDDVVSVGVEHLVSAPDAIISFGQGCEGEPLLSAPILAEAIRALRIKTARGTINLNSNAGNTKGLSQLAAAGLDSLRVSLISATPAVYTAYHRPSYSLVDVHNSLQLAVQAGVYTSLNLLVFPGLTDCPTELAALLNLIRETGLHMVQLRNLNIDPAVMAPLLPKETPMGIAALIDQLQKIPGLAVGNFTRPRE